jgi:RNA ligase (TIGR02306 family)
VSEFHVKVVRIGKVEKHPSADNLSVTHVADYPCIVRTGEIAEGDLAVYVPIDSVVPKGDPRWAFLGEHLRIRARRLRGVFSMGLLVPADPGMVEGDDVAERLGITKYEPPEPFQMGGDNEKDFGYMPVYTDIEGLRAHPDLLQPSEEVALHEKVHGSNGRALFHKDRLWVGSHTGVKRMDPTNLWWKAALAYDLEAKMRAVPGIVIYWEVYGWVQNLRYGIDKAHCIKIALFDALDMQTRVYLDHDDFTALAIRLELPTVPLLFRGPWDPSLKSHAEGPTVIGNGVHVREGFVVRPVKERFAEALGDRLILKMHGEGFLTRKGG